MRKFGIYGSMGYNMLIGLFCKPFSMLIGYAYIPIVLDYLGDVKYGIWSTILTILSWINYFDIGIGNGLRNRLTEALNGNTELKSRKLVSSAYMVISMIVVVISSIFCYVAAQIDWQLFFKIESCEENLTVVVCVSVIFVTINFVLSICKNVLYALQKSAVVSIMEVLIQALNLVGILIVRYVAEANLFYVAFIYGMSMLVVNLITSVILYAKEDVVRPSVHEMSFDVGKQLTQLGMQFFVIQICALVLFTTDNIIISYLYGASYVTPYSTVNMVFVALASVFTAIITPVWSAVTKVKTEKKYGELQMLIKKLHVIMIPFWLGAVFLVVVFRPLTGWWLRKQLNYSTMLIVLGGIYCILSIWCNTYSSISNGLELMKVSMVTAVIQASLNIPLSLYFASCLGMESTGILLGTVLSMTISAIVQPVCVHGYLKLAMKKNDM